MNYKAGQMGKMIAIGEFARIGETSIQALRHYDQLGILKPSKINPENGYRFYSEDQLFLLNNIKMLQEVGFTLREIASLSRSGEIKNLVLAYREKADHLTAQIAQLRRAQKQLTWYAKLLECMISPYSQIDESEIGQIRTLEIPEHRLLLVRSHVIFDYPSMMLLYNQLLKRLFTQKSKIEGGLITIFFGGYEGIYHQQTDIGLAFQLTNNTKRGKIYPAQRFVSCLHRGKYPSSLTTYERLRAFASENGLRLKDPVQHVLRIPIAATEDPNATVFEVRIPIDH